MSRLVLVVLPLALLLSVALSQNTSVAGSADLSSSVFNATPVKVFDVTNSTDSSTWLPASIPYTGVIFGPGPANTTVWAYGLTYTTGTSGTISAIVQRQISTPILTSGNDTGGTELSVIGPDSQESIASKYQIATLVNPVLAVGVGYLAAVTVNSVGSSNPVQSVILSFWAAGTVSPTTTTIVSSAPDSATSTTDYNIGSVWYQDGYFYITYTVVTGTGSPSVSAWNEGSIYLQAISALNASRLYLVPKAVATGLTAPLGASPRTSGTTSLYVQAGPSNYTLPQYVYVLYKSSTTIMGVPVNWTNGIPGQANTLTTDVTQTNSAAGYTYLPAGVWYANSSYGALISKQAQAAGSSVTTYSYSLVSCNGSTCADSGLGNLASAATTSGNQVTGLGFPYNNTGYLIIASYPTATSGQIGISMQKFNSTGSAISTSVTIGTVQGNANFFIDSIDSFWMGYSIIDTANPPDVYSGYIGLLIYNLFPNSFGNVLASFFALLTFLLASLFAF